eukprot:TRINITY_DN3915_c0_g1_i1.p1 TRINITY_DN3915_c0_g1~~TRINITY_DN3915_c0_g1_i1.p1  ORF type:complete len:477 (+),score=65.54 TRINITY_DN3915_c0_g1_i1:158-1588(+)
MSRLVSNGMDDFEKRQFSDIEDVSGSSNKSYTSSSSNRSKLVRQTGYNPKSDYVAINTMYSGVLPEEKRAASRRKQFFVLILVVLCICLGTVNRVVYQIQLVPMHHYPLLISDVLSLTYAVVYLGVFFFKRFALHTITPEMYRPFNWRFVAIGLCDATGQVLGIFSASHISGYLTTLLPQGMIPMTMVLCFILLRQRYNLGQVLGALLIIAGAIIVIVPEFKSGASATVYWAIIFFFSTLPSALSFTLKEVIFRQKETDIFVVNSLSAIFQLIATALYLPIVLIPGVNSLHLTFHNLPQYVSDGFQCFAGHKVELHNASSEEHNSNSEVDSCHGMPYATLIYVTVNLSWNITILLLVKQGGAVLTFIALAVIVPLSNLAFLIKWPLLGAAKFNGWDILALGVILVGLVIYRIFSVLQTKWEKQRKEREELGFVADRSGTGGVLRPEEQPQYEYRNGNYVSTAGNEGPVANYVKNKF